MVRLSVGLAPAHAAAECVELVRAADDAGLYGCYLGDDLGFQDPWVICGAAARETERIRLGLSVTHAYLREPTMIAQGLATLDQLSGGRIEAGIGIGSVPALDAHHVEHQRPIPRLRESLSVIRRLLDEGRIDHEGEFFHYTGVRLGIRPVQRHLPLLVGAMVGPRSLRLAGEVADGVHATGCSRTYAEYVVEHVSEGARQAGRDPGDLDIATFAITVVADDTETARWAARAMVAGWMASFPRPLVTRLGLSEDVIDPIATAMGRGEVEQALRRTPDDLVDALAVAGTPEECVERIRTDIVGSGIGHLVMGIADPTLVHAVVGREPELPDLRGQLDLITAGILPALTQPRPGTPTRSPDEDEPPTPLDVSGGAQERDGRRTG